MKVAVDVTYAELDNDGDSITVASGDLFLRIARKGRHLLLEQFGPYKESDSTSFYLVGEMKIPTTTRNATLWWNPRGESVEDK